MLSTFINNHRNDFIFFLFRVILIVIFKITLFVRFDFDFTKLQDFAHL